MDALTTTAPAPRTRLTSPALSGWPLLLAIQAAVSAILFHDYLFGNRFFAFLDVGSDTFAQFVPTLMYLAKPAHWLSAWSFNMGLGATIGPPLSPFTWLGIAGGAEHVLDLRIWVYLAKIAAGGAAFYGFLLALKMRREVAVLVALSYSFCGYVMTDGQWDPSSAEFAGYAFLLWAIARHGERPNVWLIPVAVALAAYSGAFIYSLGVFVVYSFLAALVASPDPRRTLRTWVVSIFPQCLLGVLLAAPGLVPQAYVLLDSPRVTGPQAGFGDRLAQILSTNDTITVFVELAGFFHKNAMGVGNQHTGWMNYLESPGFFAGTLVLLLIPQLWHGTRLDRRILLVGGAALAAFVFFPAIRFLAFGFGLDYFRVNSLWVTILLLVTFARALETVASRGIDRRLLIGTALVLSAGLMALEAGLRPYFSLSHGFAIVAFLSLGMALGLLLGRPEQWHLFAFAALALVGLEATVVNYPSFHAERKAVTKQTPGFNDATLGALAFIRERDPGVYRIEKTYSSVSFCDALAQGYMGVKSYWFQSAAAVSFYSGLGLLPRQSRVKNFTNWLPTFGGRFALDTLVGVKYLLTRTPVERPGFHKIGESGGVSILENELALPLGVVYEKQLALDLFAPLSLEAKDIALLNAAVVDRLRGEQPRLFDPAEFKRPSADWLTDHYVKPARQLQGRGLLVEQLSNGRVSGKLISDVPGILVFSIPYSKGWTLRVDDLEQPLFQANLGMLAADITAGTHRIELIYSLPGLVPGLLVGLAGLAAIGVLGAIGRRGSEAKAGSP